MECIDGWNKVKVYNLTAVKKTPNWLKSTAKKKKKQKNSDADLIQDFVMPDVSGCLRLTEDGHHLLVSGIYKPTVKCYDFSQLSVKFERGMDAEVMRMAVLSEDYSKVAFLQDPRWLEIHNKGGQVYRKKVPYHARDILYDTFNCEILISNSHRDVYRFSTVKGQFLKEYSTNGKVVSSLAKDNYANILWCGTEDGTLMAIDPRTQKIAREASIAAHIETDSLKADSLCVTSLAVQRLTAAVGTGCGNVLMYDIRSDKPYVVRDHGHAEPIKSLHFHSTGNMCSMDASVVNIWDKTSGAPFTRIDVDESKVAFNDMQVVPDTGMLLMTTESPGMAAYFIPSLGRAPNWCSHLDAMTEELEEEMVEEGSWDGHTFVTREDLNATGLLDLVGTSMAQAYMHGYYIQTPIYKKAQGLAASVKRDDAISKAAKDKIAADNTLKFKQKTEDSDKKKPKDGDKKAKKGVEPAVVDERYGSFFDPPAEGEEEEETAGHKIKSATFKRRQAEIAREEKEFMDDNDSEEEAESSVDEDSDADSDADSLVDMMITQ